MRASAGVEGSHASTKLSALRSSFKHRALEYLKLDRQLSRQTRFFGAAALTNTALYELSSPLGRCVVGPHVQGFLSNVGAHLHNINQRSAQRIATGTRMTPSVDVAMVRIEQQAVQGELNAMGAQDGAFLHKVTTEVDFLLNSKWLHLMRKSSAAVRTYLEIIRGVRCQMGGRIYFAHQKHREAIGCAVIQYLYAPDGVQRAAAGIHQEYETILVRERLQHASASSNFTLGSGRCMLERLE